MYAATVGADPRVRPVCRHVTTHVDVYRADEGVRTYCYGLHQNTALRIIIFFEAYMMPQERTGGMERQSARKTSYVPLSK